LKSETYQNFNHYRELLVGNLSDGAENINKLQVDKPKRAKKSLSERAPAF
jgi:hypothetical protein